MVLDIDSSAGEYAIAGEAELFVYSTWNTTADLRPLGSLKVGSVRTEIDTVQRCADNPLP